ncbi:MAG: NAD(P)H-dependent oxidoreductase [Cyclobacteriaceae bacterium]
MTAHIIYAHPNDGSFNHAMLEVVKKALSQQGIEATVSDLYAMDFDPVLKIEDRMKTQEDVKKEQDKISRADCIITIYPVWWTQMPAILKGYIDRVFAYNFAFQLEENGFPIKLLKGKKGIVISTFGHPHDYYEKEGYLAAFEKTFDLGIFDYVGIEVIKHFYFGAPVRKSQEERENDLTELEKKLTVLLTDQNKHI